VSTLDDIVRAALAQTFKKNRLRKTEAAWNDIKAENLDDRSSLREFCRGIRRGGQAAQVAEFLDRVVAALPDVHWPLAVAATHAQESGLDRAALRLAQTLMQSFPAEPDGYRLAALGLAKLNRIDEARGVLADSETSFGIADWSLETLILIEQKRRNWPAVLQTAQKLHEHAPDNPEGITNVAVALSRLSRGAEAERLIGEAVERFPASASVLKAAASIAEFHKSYELAFKRWTDYRGIFPRSRAGYVSALQILQKTRRFDLAGDLIEQAEKRFPEDRKVLAVLAAIAEREGRWQEADRHWQTLIALYPEEPEFALSAALAPISSRAERKARLPMALARLDAVHEQFPDFLPAYIAHIGAFRTARLLKEAEEKGKLWCARFPDSAELGLACVSAAEDAGRFDDALAQLERLRKINGLDPPIAVAQVRVLSKADRDEEAEAACVKAIAMHPKDRDLLAEYARLASRRGDWTEALARWHAAREKLPDDRMIAREISLVSTEVAGQQEAHAFAGTPAAENLFARFESLGGTHTGCEFGMVQRKFGSDGIGLLRWTRSDITDLIAALEEDLEGVGDEQNTLLTTARITADREEYVTADKRFGMKSNTFVKVSDAPFDKMFVQTCRRMRFLRGKLIEDLKAAEKIFVFKLQDPEKDETLRRLHAAMRRYGDAMLLCVTPAVDDHARGSVRVVQPGLLVGYIGYFIKAGDGGARGMDYVTWKLLAEEAERLRKASLEAPARAA
jgi:tetratricopeptide (TPR) repeat protein